MIHELRKLFLTRWAALLMLAVAAANGVLFYLHCTDRSQGYSLAEIQTAFETWGSPEAMKERLDEMDRILWSEESTATFLEISDEFFQEYRVLGAAWDRAAAARNYRQTLEDLIEENQMKLNHVLFGGSDQYARQVMEENIAVYRRLLPLPVPAVFSGGVEVLADFHLTDLFLVLFAVLPGLVLILSERSDGLLLLQRPMKKGRFPLWRWKLEAMAVTVVAGFLVLVLTDVGISCALFGLGNLLRPIQSVYGFTCCPEPLTVLGFLILQNGCRLLWALTLGCIFTFLACALRRPLATGLAAAGILAVAVAFQFSGSLWLRSLSLSGMLFWDRALQGNILLNFAGGLLPGRTASVAACLLLALLSAAGSAVLFCHTSPIVARKERTAPASPGRKARGSTVLFLHELDKLIRMHGTLAVLVLFLVFQIGNYQDFAVRRGEWESYYRHYSSVLQGPPSEEKDAYLARTEQEFKDILAEQGEGSSDPALRGMNVFSYVLGQYSSLREGQWYLYQTGWQELTGPEGLRDDLANTIKLTFVLTLCLSGLFAVERQTGVEILQISSGRYRQSARIRILLALLTALLAAAIAWLPRLILVWNGYGPLLLAAPAFSVDAFYALGGGITLGGALVLVAVLRILLALACAGTVLTVSSRSTNAITAAGVSLCIVCLPFCAAMLLLF